MDRPTSSGNRSMAVALTDNQDLEEIFFSNLDSSGQPIRLTSQAGELVAQPALNQARPPRTLPENTAPGFPYAGGPGQEGANSHERSFIGGILRIPEEDREEVPRQELLALQEPYYNRAARLENDLLLNAAPFPLIRSAQGSSNDTGGNRSMDSVRSLNEEDEESRSLRGSSGGIAPRMRQERGSAQDVPVVHISPQEFMDRRNELLSRSSLDEASMSSTMSFPMNAGSFAGSENMSCNSIPEAGVTQAVSVDTVPNGQGNIGDSTMTETFIYLPQSGSSIE